MLPPLSSFLFSFSFPFLSFLFLSFPFLHFLCVCFLFVFFFYFINCLVINYIIEFPRDARDVLSRRGGTKDVQHPGCTEYMYVTHSPLSLRSCSRHLRVVRVCVRHLALWIYLASCAIVVCVRVVDVVLLSAYRFRLGASFLPPAPPSPLSLLIQIIDLRLLKDLGNQMHMDSQVVQKCVGNIQNGLYELNETEASLLASLETLVKPSPPSTPSSSSDSLPRPLSSSSNASTNWTPLLTSLHLSSSLFTSLFPFLPHLPPVTLFILPSPINQHESAEQNGPNLSQSIFRTVLIRMDNRKKCTYIYLWVRDII